jgi:hypothetical protein
MKKQFSILILVLAISFSGCEKFLTELPKDTVAPETFYKTNDQLTAALMAVYSPLGSDDESTFSRFLVLESQATDEFLPASAPPTAINASLYNTSATYLAFERSWNNMYLGIERANLLLENLDKSAALPADIKQVRGEALFMRAYYHFLLVANWGDIPLKLTTTKSASDVERPRTPAKQVYDQIIADMTEAEGLVKTSSAWGVTNTARISKTGIQGILSRVCLHAAGRLRDRTYLPLSVSFGKKVVASGEHRLNLDFKQVFINHSQDIDDNRECIWEVQFTRDANGAYFEFERFGSTIGIRNDDILNGGFMQGNFLATGTFYNSYADGDLRRDWTIANFTYAAVAGARSPLNGNVYVRPAAQWGRTIAKWRRGYQSPGQKLIKNFGPTNFPLLRYADILLTLAEAQNELDGPTPENIGYVNEVRKRGYGVDLVGRNVKTLTITNGGTGTAVYTLNSIVTFSGGGASKDAKAAISSLSTTGRIASITLIDGGANYTSVPTITISGGTGAIITPILSNLTDYEIKVSDFDRTSFKTFLMTERSRELAGEAHRRLDLLRWGNFVKTMKDMIPATTIGARFLLPVYQNVTERDTLFPIPIKEINLNPAMRGKQNKGWE